MAPWQRWGWLVLGGLCAACSGTDSPPLGGPGVIGQPPGGTGQGSGAGALSVTVDPGPVDLMASGVVVANVLYATVTVCTPGSTTACQDIDHVQVDTGSVGLRVLHEAMTGTATPRPLLDPATGHPLGTCTVFADGYTWGSVVVADVVIANRRISGMSLNVIGDPATGIAPDSCTGGNGPDEGTVAAFGANGVLGVGVFLQDCGDLCTQEVPASGAAPYYACSDAGTVNQSCTPTTVALSSQLWNPVALLSSDNNGLLIQLPVPAASGAPSLSGSLVFGIGTTAQNGLGSARLLGTSPVDGTISTSYAGRVLGQSVIDSGSTAYYFADPSIPVCPQSSAGAGFYCPETPLMGNATLSGSNAVASPVSFTITSASALFGGTAMETAFPDLGGPLTGSSLSAQTFDWGLPFFYGRTVYVLLEQRSASGETGPALGF